MLVLALALLAARSELDLRRPTDNWVVNFADARCVAQRNYGSSEKPLFLAIKKPPLGDTVQLAFIEKRWASDGTDYDATLKFDDREPIKVSILKFEPKGAAVRTFSVNLPLNDFAPAKTAKSLTIRAPGLNEKLELSGMAKLLNVMDDCVADLKRVWNVSEQEAERTDPVEGVTGDARGLFSSDDYPMEAVMEEGTGSVLVALLVDETGRVADCSVIESSKVAILDGQTCAILRERARFKPATDAAGKNVKGSFRQRITWRIQQV